MRFQTIAAAVALVGGLAVAGYASAAAMTSGSVEEVFALPGGYVAAAPDAGGFIRTGRPGAWGGSAHERLGRSGNDQFNPLDEAGGSYLATGGISAGRFRIDFGEKVSTGYVAVVDGFDRNATQGFSLAIGQATGDGWQALGGLKLDRREESGVVHWLKVSLAQPARHAWLRFTQESRRAFSGDIVAFAVARRGCRR